MWQFRFLAGIILVVLFLAASVAGADIYATAEGRIIRFKDTEYGVNYDNGMAGWSIWRKPITAAQAEAIKRANVAHLEVPRHYQEVSSSANPAHELTAAGAMRPHVSDKHPGVKVYSYKLQFPSIAPSDRGKMFVLHEVLLVVSPASRRPRKLIQHERIQDLRQPRVEIVPQRTSAQTWDVYLVITEMGRLAGANPHFPHWPNHQDDWSVRLEYGAVSR